MTGRAFTSPASSAVSISEPRLDLKVLYYILYKYSKTVIIQLTIQCEEIIVWMSKMSVYCVA